jgi:cellulose synthase/poly-beta-1,6-N-acetylglucosamine synthase-like glycosyltransferase
MWGLVVLDFRPLEGPPLARADSARWRGFSAFQIVMLGFAATGFVALAWSEAELLFRGLVVFWATVFVLISTLRVVLMVFSGVQEAAEEEAPAVLPAYSILCALHDEAEMVGQLIENLRRIDYPPDRLEGFIILEAHDHATREAVARARRPDWLQTIVIPPGHPQTKPRALNQALAYASGDLLTIYDAEDDPDPQQLREAAAAFARDHGGRLACLQAPLRIRRRYRGLNPSPFVDRQFAAEYAALFEVALPGLARLGLPFPLGGTSNHFRTSAIRAVGGWDAHNVTEDADLGFRLWRRGYRLGVLSRPTLETPPGQLDAWLPQRTRWLKGYLQTFGVHTRWPWRLGVRGLFALMLTLGAGLASAAIHAPSLAWLVATLLLAVVSGQAPEIPLLAILVFGLGVLSAWLSCAIGARRAGVPYGLADMLAAPAYWAMLSLAFVHAFYRLIRQPFAWDKTRHSPDAPPASVLPMAILDAHPVGGLSAAHAAAPEPIA